MSRSHPNCPSARLIVVNPAALTALIDHMAATRPPVDDRETASIERFRSELTRLTDPCSEHSDTTHVTSSAIVVGPRGILLHRHKRLGIWLQPGGHIDPGEDPADAAMRETLEETGIAAEHFVGAPLLVHVDAHDGPRGHFHLDLRYLLTAGDVDPVPPKGESPDVRWWPWDEARTIGDPGLQGIIRGLMIRALRTATPDDAPAVAELFLRSFQWTYESTAVRLAHAPNDVRRWVREELLPAHHITVATSAGVVIGYAAELPGWLSHLYIDPAWVGQGVGRSLLVAAMAHQPKGFDLWTFEANERARRFYEQHGLNAVEFGDGSTNEERQPDVRYRWSGSAECTAS